MENPLNQTSSAPQQSNKEKPLSTPLRKERDLTLKQRRFVEVTAQTLNPSEAVRQVYDVKNDNVAGNIASDNLKKPKVKSALERALSLKGDTDVVKKALNTPTPDTIEWKDLHKFVETSLKLKGYLSNTQQNTQVNVGLHIDNN